MTDAEILLMAVTVAAVAVAAICAAGWAAARRAAPLAVSGAPPAPEEPPLDVAVPPEVQDRLRLGERAEEERDRLFNLSIDLLAVGGFDGFLQQCNPAWVRVLGWSRDDLMGRQVTEFVHAEDRQLVESAFGRLEQGEQVDGLECRFECRDGTYRWLSWNSFPYADRRRIFSVVRDITVQKRAESLLLENQARLRALSNQLSLVEDRARRQLAEAIHDGLAQQLFGLRAQVTLLKYPEKLDDPAAVVSGILAILDETMTQARSLMFELFPPVLYEVGLAAALEALGRQFGERTGLVVDTEVPEEEPELGEDLRLLVYQSVRELLANVHKHADAARVWLELVVRREQVIVTVRDDGVGYDPEVVESTLPTEATGGFGLFSIRERLRPLGGTLVTETDRGAGCTARITFPLPAGG